MDTLVLVLVVLVGLAFIVGMLAISAGVSSMATYRNESSQKEDNSTALKRDVLL